MKYVCQFSCGAASAVAAKLTLQDKGSPNVVIVNAFLKEEHPDNRRFLADCEVWFSNPITVLKNETYGASAINVFRALRFIKNRNSAPCSRLLKRDLLATVMKPGDIAVIGYTAEEEGRADRLQELFPQERFYFPLIDYHLNKKECLAIISRAGIKLPEMYLKGYANANCIGCPKGGQNYWQRIRRDFPQQFNDMRIVQEEIGPGANFLRFRSGPRKDERMSLADLPPGDGNLAEENTAECDFLCEFISDIIL